MAQFKDLTGKKFGRWTVQYRTTDYIEANGAKRVRYHCVCDCGNEADVISGSLSKGLSRSCGCLQRDFMKSGNAKRKHGETGTRLYRIWKGLNNRTHNPNNPKYARYGERGIGVAEEWRGENGFTVFKEWALSNGYDDNLSIDRINNDGDYCPQNCRWVNNKAQANNTSVNRRIEVDGTERTIAEWIEYLGISKWKLYYHTDDEIKEVIKKNMPT